jgi:hypothetical protein
MIRLDPFSAQAPLRPEHLESHFHLVLQLAKRLAPFHVSLIRCGASQRLECYFRSASDTGAISLSFPRGHDCTAGGCAII